MTKKRSHDRLNLSDMSDYEPPERVSKLIDVHPNTLRDQCRRGAIPCVKVGRSYRIAVRQLLGLEEEIA